MRKLSTLIALGLLSAACLVQAAEKPDLPPPPPPEVKPEVKYKMGSGFTIAQAEDFTLQVTGRIQARYTFENFDNDNNPTNLSNFTSERVRFGAKGTFFKDWKYELQADFGKSKVELRDAAIGWEKHPGFGLWAGQFKTRFDRQQLVSSGRQMFVDRSLTSSTFGVSRDVGLMFAGAPFNKKLQWNVGIFDGEGISAAESNNKNDGHQYVARVSFNPNGDFGMAESDIKKTDYHLWYIDLAHSWNNDIWVDADPDGAGPLAADKIEQPGELTDTDTWTFGFGYRHAGLFMSGEYFDRSTGKEDGTSRVDSDGWYVQFGYMIVRDKWEIAARYSDVDPNDDKDDDKRTETMLGVNRYFKGLGHSLKLNTDFAWLDTEKVAPTDDFGDFRLRTQLQVTF